MKRHWDFFPNAASREGIHEYDGRMPDVSPSALARRMREVRADLALLGSVDTGALSRIEWLDHQVLTMALKRMDFEMSALRVYETNPLVYVSHVNLSNYVLRDYAPLAERAAAMTQALAQVPRVLDTARLNLMPVLKTPVVETAIDAFAGMKQFYRADLPDVVGELGDPELSRRFQLALNEASLALDRFLLRLERLREQSVDEFAIGSEHFRRLLEYSEMITTPLDRLLAVGERDLARNLARIKQAAAEIAPSRTVRAILQEMKRHHPASDELIATVEDLLDDMRQFLIENDIVTVPAEEHCIVRPTPAFIHGAFAALDVPRAYEDNATESFYYITLPRLDWEPELVEEWLTSYNYPLLEDVTVHEAYPGHYVQTLHSRKAHSKISLAFASYAFDEGWAHYAEEMMVEEGYLGNDPRYHLAQLMEALLRDCRFVCAIKMHTQGMTIVEATQFFIDNAYLDDLPAREEATRGAYDPMYLNYTLGKLEILKLREECRLEQGEDFSLKRFHDELLSYGAPPIALLRKLMLRQGDDDAV